MSSKFSRFLNLERSRGERPKSGSPSQLGSTNRFEHLSQRGEAPQSASVPETHLERFRGDAPLALAEPQAEQERFPRCARCESDNGRFAQECSTCGADLNTPQQRAYNDQLWRKRQQDMAREREASQALSHEKLEAERRGDQARYGQMLEKLREEERRERMGTASLEYFLTGDSSIGWKLLSLISNPVVRTAVLFALIIIPAALWRYGVGRARTVGMVMLFAFIALMLPMRRRRWWL